MSDPVTPPAGPPGPRTSPESAAPSVSAGPAGPSAPASPPSGPAGPSVATESSASGVPSGPRVPSGPGVLSGPAADPAPASGPGPQEAARAARRRLRGRATVQVWFNVVLGVMVLLVVVFAAIGGHLLSRESVISDRLADRVQPSRVEGIHLQTALLDQETGLRGYVLTHDERFLTPYSQGVADERAVVLRLRPLIEGNARATADLTALEGAARQWRQDYAVPLVQHTGQGRPSTSDGALLDGSRHSFDHIRALFTAQDQHLQDDRTRTKAQLRHVTAERNAVLLALLVSFLAAALVLVLLLRQIVGRPLTRLRDDALLVAAGGFDTPIGGSGPADLRILAEAMEAMRSRLAGALAEAHDQRGQLAEQAEELTAQAAELTAQAHELRRSNSELEQFAYVASHDLQEPLRKVASFCQLLEKRYRDQLDERGVQYIDFAVDGAKRMQVLITDLLAFSRVGRTQDDRLPVRLDDALDHALANLAGALEESGARVVRPAELPRITGDPTLLTMLWQNLLGNAVKFRSPGRAPVIEIETGTGPDGEHTFAVTDNGIGIPKEFGEKVFVIFQRLHSRDVYEGTGIGLAMCRKIVEHHGGRIRVDTGHTQGTRIRFTLPAPGSSPLQGPPPTTEGEHRA